MLNILRQQPYKALALSIAFFLIGLWLNHKHEMWGDELQAWLLARDSHSIIELFNNLKYEGHPGLWHLLLMPITRISGSPVAMQYCNLLIATAAVFVLCSYSQFSWLQKSLIVLGYYFIYEYGAIARNYTLGVLFVFILCALFSYGRNKYISIAVTLLLLSHTSVLGLIFAIIFFVGLVADEIMVWNESNLISGRVSHAFFGIIISVFGFISAFVQMNPPEDSAFSKNWIFQYNSVRLNDTLHALIDAYLPIPRIGLDFWNNGILVRGGILDIICVFFVVFIVGVFAKKFFNRPAAFIVYIGSTVSLLLFFYVKYIGSWRHHGFLFVALLAALWIEPFSKEINLRASDRKLFVFSEMHLSSLFYFILICQLVGGAIAAYQGSVFLFSGAKGAADYILGNKLEEKIIIGDSVAVAGYLNRNSLYDPAEERYVSFVRYDKKHAFLSENGFLGKFSDLANQNLKEGVLVIACHEDIGAVSDFKFFELYRSASSVIRNESFCIYKFELKR